MLGTHMYDPLNYVLSDRIGEKNLQKLYQKIHTEFLTFENEICLMDTNDVFYKAADIVPVMQVYEKLLSLAPSLTDSAVSILLEERGLIKACCEYWQAFKELPADQVVSTVITRLIGKAVCA